MDATPSDTLENWNAGTIFDEFTTFHMRLYIDEVDKMNARIRDMKIENIDAAHPFIFMIPSEDQNLWTDSLLSALTQQIGAIKRADEGPYILRAKGDSCACIVVVVSLEYSLSRLWE